MLLHALHASSHGAMLLHAGLNTLLDTCQDRQLDFEGFFQLPHLISMLRLLLLQLLLQVPQLLAAAQIYHARREIEIEPELPDEPNGEPKSETAGGTNLVTNKSSDAGENI